VIVLDTHALVWWLAEPARLSAAARRAIDKAVRQAIPVAASAISLFEIATLVRRGRLVLTIAPDRWVQAALGLPELRVLPVSVDIAWQAGQFAEALPGDPADRIIVATATANEARLVTADDRLRAAGVVATIW
jgi:PIN domain nuclease of toxin-antitoxin system